MITELVKTIESKKAHAVNHLQKLSPMALTQKEILLIESGFSLGLQAGTEIQWILAEQALKAKARLFGEVG